MKTGRYETSRKRRSNHSKSLALVLSLILVIGCVAGGTLAWLTADSGPVTNTFTESNIDIKLDETKPQNKTAPMVPGWTIDKDPKVTVEDGSEDCWLFVKITESVTPDLDDYISYAIASGWEIVKPTDTNSTLATISTLADKIVIGRKVYKNDTTKEFSILGAGSYTNPMGDEDGFTIRWGENQVCVKPSVTEQMMEAIRTSKPTLNFQAYAVQLFKTNSDGSKENTADEFTAAEAWARAADMDTNP